MGGPRRSRSAPKDVTDTPNRRQKGPPKLWGIAATEPRSTQLPVKAKLGSSNRFCLKPSFYMYFEKKKRSFRSRASPEHVIPNTRFPRTCHSKHRHFGRMGRVVMVGYVKVVGMGGGVLFFFSLCVHRFRSLDFFILGCRSINGAHADRCRSTSYTAIPKFSTTGKPALKPSYAILTNSESWKLNHAALRYALMCLRSHEAKAPSDRANSDGLHRANAAELTASPFTTTSVATECVMTPSERRRFSGSNITSFAQFVISLSIESSVQSEETIADIRGRSCS